MKTKKPVSEAKLAANRANAKKSTGPKTPEGKARSSKNSERHGVLARRNTLDFENKATYLAIHQGIEDTFQPQNEAEQSLIDEYSNLHWRLVRLRAMETRLLEDACYPGSETGDVVSKAVNGFKNLHGEDSYALLQRYEMRLSRMKSRALDDYLKVRAFTENYPPANENTIVNPGPIGGQTNPTAPPIKPASPRLEFARAAAILTFFLLLTLTQATVQAAQSTPAPFSRAYGFTPPSLASDRKLRSESDAKGRPSLLKN